jgi:hypothetical protein
VRGLDSGGGCRDCATRLSAEVVAVVVAEVIRGRPAAFFFDVCGGF